jgi:hypothetical protein
MSDLIDPEATVPALMQKMADMQQMQLVVSLRIYDALATLIMQTNKEDAEKLLAMHSKWEYIGPLPFQTTEE